MTRFLSESLQAPEPFFRLHLRRLEAENGKPSADIRLTNTVHELTQRKLAQLGLDPHDTTPAELYQALQEKLRLDDSRLVRRLRTLAAQHVSAEANTVDGMVHAMRELPQSKRCFAMKSAAFRRLIKEQPPKKVMKTLGYRSIDSMLKQESSISILAAASISELPTWQRRFKERYKKLTPLDFENRALEIFRPSSKRWQALANKAVSESKQNLLVFPELGAIVLMPIPQGAPVGATTISLALALAALNEVRATSAYLKLSVVRSDFGTMVLRAASRDVNLQGTMLDRQVSWQLVQRYYSQFKDHFHSEVFEPHLSIEDLAWHGVEQAMCLIEPSLHFWQNTAHVALLSANSAVSFNIFDNALSACNRLDFGKRLLSHFQKSLWHELLMSYFHPFMVEQNLLAELYPQKAYAKAIV